MWVCWGVWRWTGGEIRFFFIVCFFFLFFFQKIVSFGTVFGWRNVNLFKLLQSIDQGGYQAHTYVLKIT